MCTSIKTQIFEYVVPSPVIYDELCMSHDKTELFIVSMIRLIGWIVVFVLFSMIYQEGLEYDVMRYLLYLLMSINVLYIGLIVLFVKPVFSVQSDRSVLDSDQSPSIPYSLKE